MERIDARRALELLTDVVDAYGPGYVYEKVMASSPAGDYLWCRYQSDGHPSCIVGHVLHRAGVDAWALMVLDDRGAGAVALYQYLEDVDQDACAVLSAAQTVQDAGRSWGEALDAARNKYEKINAETEIED